MLHHVVSLRLRVEGEVVGAQSDLPAYTAIFYGVFKMKVKCALRAKLLDAVEVEIVFC